jgi:Icc-related predicted phosphoesterase
VVSDVHGSSAALRAAGVGADALLCLGDLVLFVDYEDHSRGIFAELFGPENTAEFIRLRTAGDFVRAREWTARLWDQAQAEHQADRAELLERMVREQYADLFAAMPTPAYLTYGNVDVPRYWADYLRPGHQVLDGEVVELDGLRFGFIGGGLRSPMRTPYELDEATFDAKIAALGEVDVLCSHIPPAVAELTYDVVARRFEIGSRALLEYVRDVQPQAMLFGHVHQPAAARLRIGRTECQNVGHFAGSGAPFALSW